jgi:formylglycine-generating enzyme required for sulfatase activity
MLIPVARPPNGAPMPLVACPSCGRQLRLDAAAGSGLRCPACQAPLTPDDTARAGQNMPTPSPASRPGGAASFLSPPQAPDELGRLGRFRVLRRLGEGGMGVVFEAEDTGLKRRVALKVMQPEAAAHPEGRARFVREAQAVAALNHDHIIPIHEVGEERGAPFFVMPLLKGQSLQDRLKRQRPLPVAEAVRVAREMAEGLAAAHTARLIHRDVKPGNVWLEEGSGRVKLLDFGLARQETGGAGMTRTGAVLGTPAYMAPEQAGGKPDHRADLFSLGVVLYEMLTGKRPFRGSSLMEVLRSVCLQAPTPPQRVNPAVPEDVSALVLALLAKEPTDRPATAEEVARRLRALEGQKAAAPLPSRMTWAAPGPAVTTQRASAKGGRSRTAVREKRGRAEEGAGGGLGRWLLVGVVVAALGAGVAVGVAKLLARSKRPAPEEAARPPEPDGGKGEQTGPTPLDPGPALEFAEALHTAASVTLLERHEARLKGAEGRLRQQEPVAAAQAFGAALYDAARDGLARRPEVLDSWNGPVPAAKVREIQQAWAKYLGVPAETTVDLGGGVKLELVLVPPGRFLMGSPQEERDVIFRQYPQEEGRRGAYEAEAPQHKVELTRGFYLGRFAVTQEQFEQVLGRNPSGFRKGGFHADSIRDLLNTNRLPVDDATWYDAVELCNKLSVSQKKRAFYDLTVGKRYSEGISEATVKLVPGADGFRLPTEAEWEYACRAGTRSAFHFGDRLNGDKANTNGNYPYLTELKGKHWGRPQPVGSYDPNAFGLYDMHGNVAQWCGDAKRAYQKGFVEDPFGGLAGPRLTRGGSWSSIAGHCRAAFRGWPSDPAIQSNTVGFRVALTVPPSRAP